MFYVVIPRLGETELVFLLSITRICVVSIRRSDLFLWVLGKGRVILLWHSIRITYNY